MIDDYRFLNDLNAKQKEICQSNGNYILTACPGSGKTRTITYRLAYLQQKYKSSRKFLIAITYTNRAAEEIEKRLDDMGIDLSCIWTGTIHQFCMHFIIRPYAMYSPKLSKGYRIIDEYVKLQYCQEIATELGITLGFEDPITDQRICTRYKSKLEQEKEIDFDQILELSFELLKNNQFISENIAEIIRCIHIDEYQDTKELQYLILAEIIKANTAINLLFVGDANQAIYGTLGSVAKKAEQLRAMYPITFCEDMLNGCYRSTQRLVDYYAQFEVHTTNAVAVSGHREVHGIIKYSQTVGVNHLAEAIAEIILERLAQGISEREICIAAPQWYMLYPISKELQRLLPMVHFDSPDITPFKYDRMNPFYLLAQLTFTKAGTRVSSRKRTARELIEILLSDYGVMIPEQIDAYSILRVINESVDPNKEGIDCLSTVISRLFKYLHISSANEAALAETCSTFLTKARQRIDKYNLPHTYSDLANSFKEKDGIVISTIHGTKGEEYDTVIAYGLLKGYVPNWSVIINQSHIAQSEERKLLYVLCSRAKTNLYLFSETGRYTKKGNQYTSCEALQQACCDYD